VPLTSTGHAFVLIAPVAVVLFAVVGFRIVSTPPSYRVATWSLPVGAGTLPEARALTSVGGVLGGRTNADGTACFWLGNAGDQVALVWPPRYSAQGNPLTIFNQDGTPVATVGQSVNLDGSTAAPEDMQARPVLGCPRMSSVELVAP
jgi:hypothetical protein